MPLAGHDLSYVWDDKAAERISTPMPLAGHDVLLATTYPSCEISTPMPLAGHDHHGHCLLTDDNNFYSHAPRGA